MAKHKKLSKEKAISLKVGQQKVKLSNASQDPLTSNDGSQNTTTLHKEKSKTVMIGRGILKQHSKKSQRLKKSNLKRSPALLNTLLNMISSKSEAVGSDATKQEDSKLEQSSLEAARSESDRTLMRVGIVKKSMKSLSRSLDKHGLKINKSAKLALKRKVLLKKIESSPRPAAPDHTRRGGGGGGRMKRRRSRSKKDEIPTTTPNAHHKKTSTIVSLPREVLTSQRDEDVEMEEDISSVVQLQGIDDDQSMGLIPDNDDVSPPPQNQVKIKQQKRTRNRCSRYRNRGTPKLRERQKLMMKDIKTYQKFTMKAQFQNDSFKAIQLLLSSRYGKID